MTIDTTGKWWRGTEATDVRGFLEAYADSAYAVHAFRLSVCSCGSSSFLLEADDDEGAARRTCCACGLAGFIADSEEFWDDASPERWSCIECKSVHANVGAGYSMYSDRAAIRWLYVGYRCVGCGVLGCFTGWKVDSDDLSLMER